MGVKELTPSDRPYPWATAGSEPKTSVIFFAVSGGKKAPPLPADNTLETSAFFVFGDVAS